MMMCYQKRVIDAFIDRVDPTSEIVGSTAVLRVIFQSFLPSTEPGPDELAISADGAGIEKTHPLFFNSRNRWRRSVISSRIERCLPLLTSYTLNSAMQRIIAGMMDE
jgi:hypothetical protein